MPETANLAAQPVAVTVQYPPNSTAPLPEEERERLIQRALDILSGRVEPQRMVSPPLILQSLEELKREHPRTTAKALLRIEDEWNLMFYYGGNVVAAVDTPKGCVVLACGAEIGLLRRSLSDKHNSRVYTTHPTALDCPHL